MCVYEQHNILENVFNVYVAILHNCREVYNGQGFYSSAHLEISLSDCLCFVSSLTSFHTF